VSVATDARADLSEKLAVEDRGQVAGNGRPAHGNHEAPLDALHVAKHAQVLGDRGHRGPSELEQLAKRARVGGRSGHQGDDLSVVFEQDEAATVSEALQALTDLHPELRKHLFTPEGKVRSFVNLYLNDEDVRYLPNKEETAVIDSDTLSIIPSIAGGTRLD